MFGLAAGLYKAYWAPVQVNILVLGQESSGKTALVERIRVTEFTKFPKPISQSSRRRSLCPAPSKYSRDFDHDDSDHDNSGDEHEEEYIDDDDDDDDDSDNDESKENTKQRPQQHTNNNNSNQQQNDKEKKKSDSNGINRQLSNRQSSLELEDIPIDDDDENNKCNGNSHKNNNDVNKENGKTTVLKEQQKYEEFDLKSGQKMLPLSKIRPTIGMNLAKLNMCHAKCHFWDVGGKMVNLWERYYDDADAVVFVIKITQKSASGLGSDNSKSQKNKNSSSGNKNMKKNSNNIKKNGINEEEDNDDLLELTKNKLMLAQIQSEIDDNIPILVFGHLFQEEESSNNNSATAANADAFMKSAAATSETTKLAAKSLLSCKSPLVSLHVGSAKTGEGVRDAFEWLIPLTRHQKHIRDYEKQKQQEQEEQQQSSQQHANTTKTTTTTTIRIK